MNKCTGRNGRKCRQVLLSAWDKFGYSITTDRRTTRACTAKILEILFWIYILLICLFKATHRSEQFHSNCAQRWIFALLPLKVCCICPRCTSLSVRCYLLHCPNDSVIVQICPCLEWLQLSLSIFNRDTSCSKCPTIINVQISQGLLCPKQRAGTGTLPLNYVSSMYYQGDIARQCPPGIICNLATVSPFSLYPSADENEN